MEGPLWVVERRWYVEINHDGSVRLLLYLDMGATVFHFPCDPVWMTKGWDVQERGLRADCRATTPKSIEPGRKGGGGWDREKRIGSIVFLEQFPFWKKEKKLTSQLAKK